MRNTGGAHGARYAIAAGLLVSLIAGMAVAASVTNWGYLLPPQQGLYAPGVPSVGTGGLTIGNTSVTLGQNGSWYAVGFYSNYSVIVFLNVTGGQGQLAIYNLTYAEDQALQSNSSLSWQLEWLNQTASHVQLSEALAGSYDYWVFMNQGAASIAITFNLTVVP